jgi:hypothetical protein
MSLPDLTGVPIRRRDPAAFSWSASCGMPAYATLAGVPFDQLFLSVDAIVAAYREGRPQAEALFGPDVAMSGPTWAAISYGHANSLGAELIFPPDSEVAHRPVYGSLAEGIAALQREVDFTRQGMFPFYLDLWARLKRAFPGEAIGFHHKTEGPLTTGWILRGHPFLEELLTEPEQMHQFLRLVTRSATAHIRLERRLNGRPELAAHATWMVDDIAAMVPPQLWPELVVPYHDQYYRELGTGERHLHVEDLITRHLPCLDQLGLSSYDPSISPRLTPALIRDHCQTPFLWLLNSTHYVGRTPADISRWVFEAAADGAQGVFTDVAREMCWPERRDHSVACLHAFVAAARQVQQLLREGCPRTELAGRVPTSP